MPAVKVITYLLTNNSPLIAVVPADRIMAGKLPQGTALPAISIMHISTVGRKTAKPSVNEFCTSRIQVTVLGKTYPEKIAVLELVKTALPNTKGTVAGVKLDSILSGPEGPDFDDDDIGACMRSKDYMVQYNE